MYKSVKTIKYNQTYLINLWSRRPYKISNGRKLKTETWDDSKFKILQVVSLILQVVSLKYHED